MQIVRGLQLQVLLQQPRQHIGRLKSLERLPFPNKQTNKQTNEASPTGRLSVTCMLSFSSRMAQAT